MSTERQEVISWDEFFMRVAKDAALRSKDPSTQVGACIVSAENRIISVGYNGTPNRMHDSEFPWEKSDNALECKYNYVVHAELNALLNYRGCLSDYEGATIYTTLFPCNECAKAIVQAGIKHVVYESDKYAADDIYIIAKKILTACGVDYREFSCTEK